MAVGPFGDQDLKKIAIGAGVGALIAIPVPFVGPIAGAIVGGAIVAVRKLNKG